MFKYEKEKIKWKLNKEKENKILNECHFDKSKINELYEYDWLIFKEERNYINKIDFREIDELEDNIKYRIDTYDDLLNYLSNDLFELLVDVDEMTKKIILFRYYDYSYEEISKILRVENYVIHYKIRKLI